MKRGIGILLFSLYLIVFGQSPYLTTVKTYTTENGLAGRFANYTFKDSRGIIWMGTQHGLHRFDGRDMTVYAEEEGLPFQEVMEIYEDNAGYLWLYRSCFSKNEDYCTKDLAFFHAITHEILTFEERFGTEAPFSVGEIDHIISSADHKRKGIRTKNGTYLWTIGQGFQKIPANQFTDHPNLFTLLPDGRMGAWERNEEAFIYYLLGPSGDLLYWEEISSGTKPISNFFTFPSKAAIRLNFSNTIFFAKDNDFEIYEVNEEGRLEVNDELAEKYKIAGQNARQNYFDEKYQTLWAADRGGIVGTYLQKNKFGDALAFGDSKMLWGVHQLREASSNYLLARVGDGLEFFKFDLSQDKTANAAQQQIRKGNIAHGTKYDLRDAQHVFSIFEGEIVIVMEDEQLKRIAFSELTDSIFVKKLQCIKLLEDKILLGTLNGLLVYDLNELKLEPALPSNQFETFQGSSVHVINQLNADTFCVGTNHGVFCLSLSKGVFAQYAPEQTGKHYLPASTVYHLSKVKDGTYWLATREGLVHWVGNSTSLLENGSHYQFFTTKQGLPDKHCVAVYEDAHDFIWVATIKGLVQFDPASERMRIYNRKDGLKQEYFLEYAHDQAPGGELLFGGLNGLTYFDPNDFKDTDFSDPDVPLIIVEAEQYNQETEKFESRTATLLKEKKIVLRPNSRIFSLSLMLEDYRSAEKHHFSYRIPGFQEEWQTGSSQVIRVSGVPYGKSVLQVKGRLADGRYSSQMLEIPILAVRPFYLDIWFYIVLIIVLGLIAYYAYKSRIQRFENRQAELEEAVRVRTAKIEADKKTIENQAEELVKLDRLKSRFFTNVSHELRTPLTLILSPLQVVMKRQNLSEKDNEYIQVAHQNGKRLLKLVNEILDLSKLESGKMEVHLEDVEVIGFLSRIVASFESYAAQVGIRLRMTHELEKDLMLQLDSQKVEIIVVNLISNALKFTSKEGEVHLMVTSDSESAMQQSFSISVSDTGRGIHPKDLPHIFDRFYQSKEVEVAEGGTGIGLSLSKEFAVLMGGDLTATSELGSGSVFSLHLPRVVAEPVSIEAAGEEPLMVYASILPTLHEEGGGKPTVLLVEDNLDLKTFIQDLLDPLYHVIPAQHGQEALEILLRLGTCDLILSDIMMPVMDGFELLSTLKSTQAYAHIPVVMLTARAALGDKLKALRIGVDDYMLKPFEEEELMARIANLIRNSQLRKGIGLNEFDPPSESLPSASYLESQQWLELVEAKVNEKLSHHDFNVEKLAFDMAMSRQNLNTKIKKLTGLTASQYIQEARLCAVRKTLETRQARSVKAAVLEVGIKDVKYFSKRFKDRFGKSPSAYL